MLTMLLVTGFVGGIAMIGWHNSDEKNRQLRKENQRLEELVDQLRGMKRVQARPRPETWPDSAHERLASDVGIRLVADAGSDREAHSHETKGTG